MDGFISRLLKGFRSSEVSPQARNGVHALDEIGRRRAALDAYGFPFRIVAHDGAMEAFETEWTRGERDGFTPVFIVLVGCAGKLGQ